LGSPDRLRSRQQDYAASAGPHAAAQAGHPAGGGAEAEPYIRPPWTSLFDPRQPDSFLAFCSCWCALQMWLWPDEFANANALITLDVGLRGHERSWAIFGLVAALLKIAGLASRLSRRWSPFAPGLRAGGLFMSILFWTVVGLSRVIDFPHSITPLALTGLGIAAAFELAERREPRETWR
jgi:hypothetical protein